MFRNRSWLKAPFQLSVHVVCGIGGRWPQPRLTHMKRSEIYKECYRILGVEASDDQNTVRRAYIKLVKKVHPDSGHADASAARFQEVDEAFKLLQEKFAKDRRGIEDEEEEEEVKVYDIRHTAPQHRQYLSFDGVGVGNPFQRQKQYQQVKAFKAQERVLNHRVEKAQAGEGTLLKKGSYYKNHAIKTKYGIDRVVEDLIQEALSKGDLEKLSGFGKPLSSAQTQNPYLDFTTHKLNKIMLDNGFTPEWITLQREIREAAKALKQNIKEERAFFGDYPLSDEETTEWQRILERFQNDVKSINRNIDKYNLIVPILKNQLFRLNLNALADQILQDPGMPKNYKRQKSSESVATKTTETSKSDFLSFIGSLF